MKKQLLNTYPTSRQVQALADVAAHPVDSLAGRGVRLGVSRVAVLKLLEPCERKGLARRDSSGAWSVTARAARWVSK